MAMSKLALLDQRITSLEGELRQLKLRVGQPAQSALPWWEKNWGIFANDPDYDKAMELGRKYRESLRPKATKARRKSVKKAR
jgi:hypothetical protein